MVRLLQQGLAVVVGCKLGFNPTMVRLLPFRDAVNLRRRQVFQSHNGAIAALTMAGDWLSYLSFNPTMVRLLLFRRYGSDIKAFGFNPTMVRLLP